MTRLLHIEVPAEVVRGARAGQSAAQAEVYRAYSDSVYALIRRLVPRAAVAEELFQDTFVEVLQSIGRFRGEAPLGAWIRQIAVSKCLMHLRSPWNRRLLWLERQGNASGDEDFEETPFDALMDAPVADSGIRIDLDAALEKLSPAARVVLWLHDVEGYTHVEIAALCGKTVSFSKSQLMRAHLRLRELLEDKIEGEGMHASVHELLSLRDDVVVDDAIAAHVRGCEECGVELQRLRTVTSELRALPERWTAPDRWTRIETALALNVFEPMVPVQPASRTRRPGWAIPLAAAAIVTVTVAALTWHSEPEQQPHLVTAVPPTFEFLEPVQPVAQEQTEIDITEAEPLDLPSQSRKLEQMLASLPAEPAVTRAGTALTLAELHDRIRWVDYRLSRGDEEGLESRQSDQLWQERVDLLNSLVAVRYAQTRTAF